MMAHINSFEKVVKNKGNTCHFVFNNQRKDQEPFLFLSRRKWGICVALEKL